MPMESACAQKSLVRISSGGSAGPEGATGGSPPLMGVHLSPDRLVQLVAWVGTAAAQVAAAGLPDVVVHGRNGIPGAKAWLDAGYDDATPPDLASQGLRLWITRSPIRAEPSRNN